MTDTLLKPKPERSSALMAAMLAHEVKNPLAGIRGAAQLLRQQANDNDRPLTDLICREVDRINSLLQKIELFSSEPNICNQSINIHEILQYVRELAGKGFAPGLTLESNYDPSLPDVRGDRELLIQLFLNLLTNASEALANHPGGHITLRTRYQINNKFLIPGVNQLVSLPICIEIEDNGGGIDPELRSSIFEPFITSKSGGKGLGLAIVAKIVADHGGIITLDPSAPLSHTRFRVLLGAMQ